MSKLINVSLEKIIDLASKVNGKKLCLVDRSSKITSRGDVLINAIIDAGSTLYNYENNIWFYDYTKSDRVYFDKGKHPLWKANFGEYSFDLYDGIFLGHYGCGGAWKYMRVIERAKSDMSHIEDHKIIFKKFRDFYGRYLSKKEKVMGSKIKARFGIFKGVIDEKEEFAEYLRLEQINGQNGDANILIFWRWFKNNFINTKEYERKIEEVTKPEHERAFNNYIKSIIHNLERVGFEEKGADIPYDINNVLRIRMRKR